MTRNQIAFQEHLENVRSHRAQESQARDALSETKRSNQAREFETHRANVTSENEMQRSHLINEAETHRSNVAKETNQDYIAETGRMAYAETKRHNKANEELDATKVTNQQDQFIITSNINAERARNQNALDRAKAAREEAETKRVGETTTGSIISNIRNEIGAIKDVYDLLFKK